MFTSRGEPITPLHAAKRAFVRLGDQAASDIERALDVADVDAWTPDER